MSKREKIIENIPFKGNLVEFVYTINVSSARQKCSIVINRECNVVVKLPSNCPVEMAHDFLAKKEEWVAKSLEKIRQQPKTIPSTEYSDGSLLKILGESRILRILQPTSFQRDSNVTLDNGYITITTSYPEKVQIVLKQWYLKSAKQTIPPIFSEMAYKFYQRHGKMASSLEIKFVKSYWGQCTRSGKIRLNAELIKAPESFIRYIIAHELCHLVHPNHSSKFYDLLDREEPNWRSIKQEYL